MSVSHLLVDKKREALKAGILGLGDQVMDALKRSLDALRQCDAELARDIVKTDALINRERRALEQQALVVLAAYRPAGHDLRMIAASLEMVSELERIGDYAADVARGLLRQDLAAPPNGLFERIAVVGDAATAMLEAAIGAYAHDGNEAMARAAAALDSNVDRLEQVLIEDVLHWIQTHPEDARVGMRLLAMAHDYERVADRATNIAECVVYIATGETPDLD